LRLITINRLTALIWSSMPTNALTFNANLFESTGIMTMDRGVGPLNQQSAARLSAISCKANWWGCSYCKNCHGIWI